MKNRFGLPIMDATEDCKLAEELVPVYRKDNDKPALKPDRIPTLAVILGIVSMVIGVATTGAIIYVAIHFIAKHW